MTNEARGAHAKQADTNRDSRAFRRLRPGACPALYPLPAVSLPPPLLTCGLTACCGRGSVRGVRLGWECVQLARDLVSHGECEALYWPPSESV
jgi:hypothetical protein